MFKYETPASIDDLAGRPARAAFLTTWHDNIRARFAVEQARPGVSLFFSEVDSAATSNDIPVSWNAFPLFIKRRFPNNADRIQRWSIADLLRTEAAGPFRQQDEYCEWFAYRDVPDGPIRRIVFTAEAPEYWDALAAADLDRVVELYRQFVSPAVQRGDLLRNGVYNPRNKWNTTHGVMHLTHPANTLFAEINLAAQSTIMRRNGQGARITSVRQFACASSFGDVNRTSDPSIGSSVNLTVFPAAPGSTAQSITLANPVGLYIAGLQDGVLTDDNDNPLNWFRFVRGGPSRGLMAVLEPPAGAAFGLERVRIAGVPLTHGGQVAERITMVLFARTANLSKPVPPLLPAVAHCCAPSPFDPPKIDQINLSHTAADTGCSAGTVEAFPGPGVAPHGLVGAALTADAQESPYYRARRGL
jgi:hypothetical protein